MANNSDVTGFSQSVEHERGANSAPLKSLKSPKAASYRTPKAHPDNPHTNKDTAGFRGDKARGQRSIPVHPGKA